MNGGRSDASTSTDDIKGRPLCLFYFTHPFGVLSPEPPSIAAAPPNIARAFINMEPVSPFHFWPTSTATDDSYNTATTENSNVNFDLGSANKRKDPVSVVSVGRHTKCTVDYNMRRDSLSSSLLSSDVWLNSGSSCKSTEFGRRIIPYNKILPPLQLPLPKYVTLDSPDDWWPKKCYNPEKFSLPPIEMPSQDIKIESRTNSIVVEDVSSVDSFSAKDVKCKRSLGVRKQKRCRRPTNVRRAIVALMRRAVRGQKESGTSPALREALATIREAWTEPRSLFDRHHPQRDANCTSGVGTVSGEAAAATVAMRQMSQLSELGAAGASPGLMRRRYSVPETIMRKYRLAQLQTESEEVVETYRAPVTSASASRESSGSPCDSPHRFARRDREIMRKSALLRRLYGRGACAPHLHPYPRCCRCGDATDADGDAAWCQVTRSLDGSRSELRPTSGGSTTRADACGEMPTKRQRLVSPRIPMTSCVVSTADLYSDIEHSKLEQHSDAPKAESLSGALPSSTTSFEMGSDCVEEASVRHFEHGTQDFDVPFDRAMKSITSVSARDTSNECIELHDQEANATNNHNRLISANGKVKSLLCNTPLTVETPSYEVLEIVVSETLNAPGFSSPMQKKCRTPFMLKAPGQNHKKFQNINIDEYVSNILVESLNSLSDQLDYMNSSIASDKKVNIVEKEIKVKLQNTGVNTIVHLSPTSNNPIIFGNEELYNSEDRDICNNPLDGHENILIREETHSVETNNNFTSVGSINSIGERETTQYGESFDNHTFINLAQPETMNKAVLQQIQKLFQGELHHKDPEMAYPGNDYPEISHVQISNVDVYINRNAEMEFNTTDAIELQTQRNEDYCNEECESEAIASVGAANYFADTDENVIVPRFSAFPHTDSMEVNTSSSDDAEIIASDCTSLVDSLDDPNSPRSVLLRRSYNGRRSELVRSAIDVLDLLPESASIEANTPTRDKGESFFIRINDEDCECEKENINVADHMPDKIRQRLFRRHKRRELRMECARRTKVKQMKRDVEKKRYNDINKSKREIEKECMAIVNALIEDVVAKIAQEEYLCMRIKKRPNKLAIRKLNESMFKKNSKTDSDFFNTTTTITDMNPSKTIFKSTNHQNTIKEKRKAVRQQIHGKLSLVNRQLPAEKDKDPKRIYQKSEIHEGNNFIEILEILEYVNGSRSSTETTPSDENHNYNYKSKKSRIPVPVHEKNTKAQKMESPISNENGLNSMTVLRNMEEKTQTPSVEMPESMTEKCKDSHDGVVRQNLNSEPRSRRSSLGFKRSFDVIPEERTSLSLETSDEEDFNRTQSTLAVAMDSCAIKNKKKSDTIVSSPTKRKDELKRNIRDSRSVGTSPLSNSENNENSCSSKNRSTMTSPAAKSASTSPILNSPSRYRELNRDRTTAKRVEGHQEEGTDSIKLSDRKFTAATQRRKKDWRRPGYPPPVRTSAEVRKTESKGVSKSEISNKAEVKSNRTNTEKSTHCGIFSRRSSAEFGEDHSCRRFRSGSVDRHEQVKLPECKGSSSDSGESNSSLLCSLAPKWLSAHARQRRNARRQGIESAPSSPTSADECNLKGRDVDREENAKEWSVTVAGSCRAALPADVEMRLRFPHALHTRTHGDQPDHYQEWGRSCRRRAACACSVRAESAARPPLPAAPHAPPPPTPSPSPAPARKHSDARLSLTMKKEALDSSIVASRSSKKSSVPLPDVETYAASRSKLRSSVKTQQGYSLHCWLPDAELAPIRPSKGLSVLGCAIIPELKPRVPTMSERDLTRVYTPRHYLRS